MGGGLTHTMKLQLTHSFEDIIGVENLFAAWREFAVGKVKKRDVQKFSLRLTDNIIQLHESLSSGEYAHGEYKSFSISDPKPRSIHKAMVRDRVLHHALYRVLYPLFDRTFIADSYSCRVNKGTHKAMSRFKVFAGQVSRNNMRTCWVLKCDIRKFFASIDHAVLLDTLSKYIPDLRTMLLLENIVDSFSTTIGVGLPLGNLTSQLFCNVYMNEFDQLVKHRLKAKHYIRYADDFVFLSENRGSLEELLPKVSEFLKMRLKLLLHPDKVYVKTFGSGIDFLGWVHFPKHRIPRTVTRKRVMRRIAVHPTEQTLQSYLGLLKHGNAYQLRQEVMNMYGLMREI